MLNGYERMLLQGICVEKVGHVICDTKESALWFLSGNAKNFYNVSQGLLAALSTVDIDWFEN